MFCPNCGTENEEKAKFCKICGQQLSTRTSGVDRGAGPPINAKSTLFLVAAALVVIGGIVVYSLVGGRAGPSGVYANEDYPEVHLELEKDGTLYLTEMGATWLSGEWEVDGGQLRLYFPDLGTIEAVIQGDKLIAQEDIIGQERKIWIKQSNSS